jgi:hypothetical protein
LRTRGATMVAQVASIPCDPAHTAAQ